MVEFFFTEGNNSVDNEEQSSEYFYDVSNQQYVKKHHFGYIIFANVKHHLVFRHFIL